MTFFSFSLSTIGIWLNVLGFEVGFQWYHDHQESPYLLVDILTLVRIHINRNFMKVQRGDRLFPGPTIYTTVWEWNRPGTLLVIKL
jgi:hypothetical protein